MFRFNVSFIDKRHLMTKFYGGIIFFSIKLYAKYVCQVITITICFARFRIASYSKQASLIDNSDCIRNGSIRLLKTLSDIKQIPNSQYISKFFMFVLHGVLLFGGGCVGKVVESLRQPWGRNKVISCPLEFLSESVKVNSHYLITPVKVFYPNTYLEIRVLLSRTFYTFAHIFGFFGDLHLLSRVT